MKKVKARYCGTEGIGIIESTKIVNVEGKPVELCWVIFDEPLVISKPALYGYDKKKQVTKTRALVDRLMIEECND